MASLLLLTLASSSPATASNKVVHGATSATLSVLNANTALVSYTVGGRRWWVTASGAINARFPAPGARQVGFKYSYSQSPVPAGQCRRYDGPPLPWLVKACKGVTGDYWAIQMWPRNLPDFGVDPRTPAEAQSDLRLSHWRGELPVFTVKLDWTYRRYDHLYGSLTYLGRPMYGFGTNNLGNPSDRFGVLIYLDTLNSAYGSGWRRETAFVTHKGSGIFCFGFFPHGQRPAGKGDTYRATVVGPGVLPDLMWQENAPGPYDAAKDEVANAEQRESYSDRLCRPN